MHILISRRGKNLAVSCAAIANRGKKYNEMPIPGCVGGKIEFTVALSPCMRACVRACIPMSVCVCMHLCVHEGTRVCVCICVLDAMQMSCNFFCC